MINTPRFVPRALVLLCLLPTPGSADERPSAACRAVGGTYLATVTDREEVFTSRALLTLTADGSLLVTDSGLLGGPDSPSPVYTAQGSWRCYAMQPEALEIEAVAVNLALPGRDGLPGFGRIDYRLTSSTAGATLTGSAELRRFDSSDLEGAEPMTDPGDLVDRLHIEAVKLTAPQHLDPPNE